MDKRKIMILIVILIIITIIILWNTMTSRANNMDNLPETTKENYDNYTTEEVYIENQDNTIYGVLYRPKTENKVPIIIYSHGLGGNCSSGIGYAEELVKHGYAFLAFDFCGGGPSSRSTGETTDMSVLTEISDLEAVLNEVETWNFIDKEKITLFGTSQGGLVSSQVATIHEQEINGLILFYPAFVISDDLHTRYPTKDDIPEETNYLGWITVSSKYMLDVYDIDFYKIVEDYKKEVLIVHGDEDSIVDLSYSERLQNTYENAELKVIEGGGHGFYGENQTEAINYILEYLNKIES